jgi:uncharacterized membrane protein
MSGFLDDHWNRAKLLWGVFALATFFVVINLFILIFIIINVIALVLAIVWKKEATLDVYSHFSHQIKFFIFFAVIMIVCVLLNLLDGSILVVNHIPFIIANAAFIAFIAVCVIGFIKANKKKPIALIK